MPGTPGRCPCVLIKRVIHIPQLSQVGKSLSRGKCPLRSGFRPALHLFKAENSPYPLEENILL